MTIEESIGGFDHLYVETNHWASSRAFWTGLGLRETAAWGEDGHRACKLTSAHFAVVLAEANSPCPPTMHLRIDDPSAVQTHLESASSVKITRTAENTHWGTSWIRIATPDGHEIALECPHPLPE